MDESNRASHERVKAIFAEASEMTPEARRAFVASQTAGDADIAAQVFRLLEALDGPEEFLRQPTAAPSSSSSHSHDHAPTSDAVGSADAAGIAGMDLDESPGAVIGAYTLRQTIGAGGFGRVFMAEQERPVRRKVALKIIKLGMDTRQVVARFEQERQALALMDHPHIAKVLDGGATEAGRPYFVMELCNGEAITKYCDRHHLPVEERLRLFMQVCQAVQHAHQKGVIHRDIKPSNVLVATQDGRAFAKVIDFGIAKATESRLTERTLFTEHKQLIGTPEYMSPEQAEGSLDIDTRTDVYSLGVLLYELLTGTTPFSAKELRSAAFGELQRIIREVDPPNPSTRLSQSGEKLANVAATRGVEPKKLGLLVRGELDWIVMKSLEKDRARRYDSASGLAGEIERYLRGDPVIAAPPAATYRLRKFVRRHRGKVVAGGLIATALLVGAVGTSIGLVRASRERDQAQAARTDAEAATTFLTKVLSSADPKALGKDVTVRQVIDEASKKIDPSIERRPAVEARVRGAIAETYYALGELSGAESNATRAFELARRIHGEEAEATLRAEEVVGRVLFAAGDYPGAEKRLQRIVDVASARFGPQSEVALTARNTLGNAFVNSGRVGEAEAAFRAVAAGFAALKGPDDENTLSAQGSLAMVLSDQKKYEEADALYVKTSEQLTNALGPDHPTTLSNDGNYAWSLQTQGKTEEAAKLCERVLEARRRVLGPEHPETAQSANNLAIAYTKLKRFDDAAALHEGVLALERRLRGSEHPETLINIANIAKFYMDTGSLEKALPLFVEGEAGYRKILGKDHPQTAYTILGHGICLRKMEKTDDAITKLTEAYTLLTALGPQQRTPTRRAAQELALAYEKLGRADDASTWRATAESLKNP